jgi:hypothetical protein
MKNVVFWHIKIHFVPHRRHITPTLPKRLILYKISGFRSGDYEKFRLLGYYAVWFL